MAAQKTATIGIKVREDSFLKAPFFVNQYRVHQENQVITLFLGFNAAGQNLFNGLIVLNETTLYLNRDTILPYYERLLNADHTPANESQFASSTTSIYHGSLLEFSHYGELAQLRLVHLSLWHLVTAIRDTSKPSKLIPAEVSCIFGMPMAIQLGIIKKLYIRAA